MADSQVTPPHTGVRRREQEQFLQVVDRDEAERRGQLATEVIHTREVLRRLGTQS